MNSIQADLVNSLAMVGIALTNAVNASFLVKFTAVTGIVQMSIVPPWLAIGALVFAAFIAVIGGFYPAARAARLDPVEALQHGEIWGR